MGFQLLGQLRPANTTAASVYSPPASTETIISMVKCANVSALPANVRIFLDDDGTTYDETTALHWDVTVGVGETLEVTGPITMNDASGNLAVRTSVADAINFTVFGNEVSV